MLNSEGGDGWNFNSLYLWRIPQTHGYARGMLKRI